MLERIAGIPKSFVSADNQRLNLIAYLFLLILCIAFFTPGIVTMPPTDRDESSFAQASKQMIESGDYTDIHLQAAPRYKKPIGIYWLQSTAVRLFNPHHLDEIWAYRLPSLLGATIAVLMTAALGTLLFNPLTGLIAAMMLAGCVLLNVEARLAKTDAALLACIMVSLYGLAHAYLRKVSKWGLTFAFWTAVAAGILIKGPIILLPLCAVLLWLKISDKSLAWFRNLRPALGLIYALVLVLPWFIAISLHSHGAFMHQSAGNDMFAKLWQGQNRGMLAPGMHLLALPIAFFPFALFIVLAAPDAWKNRQDASVKFCLGWIIPTWIVFELSLTKLPHYVLPTYPALAILAAKFLNDGLPTLVATTRRLPVILVVGFWFVVGMGFATLFALLPVLVDHVWQVPQIAAGIALLLSQGAALLFLAKQKTNSIIALTLGALIFFSTTFGILLPHLQHIWMSREIVALADTLRPCSQSQIVAVGYHEPSLAFLGGTDTIMAVNGTDAANSLKENNCRIAVIDNKHQQEFTDAFAGSNAAPKPVGTIDGLNSGHGTQAQMTLYVMPQ